MFKSRQTKKISLEGLKKNIIEIYSIVKQINFNDSKKGKKFKKKWHILENLLRQMKLTARGAWVGGGKVNIPI